jgi:hypothetical protein
MVDSRNYYAYQSDDGNTYQVALAQSNATVGGFGSPVADGVNGGYPVGWKMRHLSALGAAGQRTIVPANSHSNAAYMNGGTFTKNGVAYQIQGRIGERMTSKK